MLYDILIIDDDFSGESVLDDLELSAETQGNRTAWDNTIMPLYFKLTRENLKIIWSTGEMDDLEKLGRHQLSTIKYIICDLHLLGIDPNATNKTIVSKIMGILDGLKDTFGDNVISFLINSKYIGDHSGIEDDLQTMLNRSYPKKYTVEEFSKKNAITPQQTKQLVDTSLLSHIKEQIIKKHLEVERVLGEQIKIADAALKDEVLIELSFSSKYKIVKELFDLNENNRKIKNLMESRNYIAHNEINSFVDLKRKETKRKETLNKLKCFSSLTAYIEEINHLIATIKNAQKR